MDESLAVSGLCHPEYSLFPNRIHNLILEQLHDIGAEVYFLTVNSKTQMVRCTNNLFKISGCADFAFLFIMARQDSSTSCIGKYLKEVDIKESWTSLKVHRREIRTQTSPNF